MICKSCNTPIDTRYGYVTILNTKTKTETFNCNSCDLEYKITDYIKTGNLYSGFAMTCTLEKYDLDNPGGRSRPNRVPSEIVFKVCNSSALFSAKIAEIAKTAKFQELVKTLDYGPAMSAKDGHRKALALGTGGRVLITLSDNLDPSNGYSITIISAGSQPDQAGWQGLCCTEAEGLSLLEWFNNSNLNFEEDGHVRFAGM